MLKYLIIINIILTNVTIADIVNTGNPDDLLIYTNEYILSFEKQTSKKMSTLIWGGYGLVHPISEEGNPSYGFEIAAEKRLYFISEENKFLFSSLYLGFGHMSIPTYYDYPHSSSFSHKGNVYQEHITANQFSLGLKFGCKFIAYENDNPKTRYRLSLEPYYSISGTTWSGNAGPQYFGINTLGIRFIFEIFKPKLKLVEVLIPEEPMPEILNNEKP